MNRNKMHHFIGGVLIAAPLGAGLLLAAGPAAATPAHQGPALRSAVQTFGPFATERKCNAHRSYVMGGYQIPLVRQSQGWHEGARFSVCAPGQRGWTYTLTAPTPREHRF